MSVSDIQKKVAPVFSKFGIRYAAIFGSVSRGTDKKDSDVDILIRPGTPMGLLTYTRLIRETEQTLERKVDMVTEKGLNKFIKPHIAADLKTIYEER